MTDRPVSRETREKLGLYQELLVKWSKKINLVSAISLGDASSRHFEDSLQLLELVRGTPRTWVDLGSGGGFPGLVVAILAQEKLPDLKVTLVESDQRKCAFLRTVSRETSCPVEVLPGRIEAIPALDGDILSARALADLPTLLRYAQRHMKSGGTALFPKGRSWQSELKEAEKAWSFDWQRHKSRTNPEAVILEIGAISRV